MLSPKMEEALNAQINAEYYSSYLYLAMSAYAESVNFHGTAHWFRKQAHEELEHVEKFFAYIVDRGGRVKLKAIEAPQAEWKSVAEAFENTLSHEQHVTKLIAGLMEQARSENDYATEIFLQWFVSEQVEEEAAAQDILDKLDLIKGSSGGLYMLDRELGKRA